MLTETMWGKQAENTAPELAYLPPRLYSMQRSGPGQDSCA